MKTATLDGAYLVIKDGTLWAWGANNTSTQVDSDADWIYVASNPYVGSVLAIEDDGTLWAWGANGNGQLGLGYTSEDRDNAHKGGNG
jgi:alpha-tubulin suppressor-like RCC1 family protein